jgi:EmrB/QacA subfamily drug resistance transporter
MNPGATEIHRSIVGAGGVLIRMTASKHRSRWTLALTSLAFFMVVLDALVVTTALPAIGRDLHVGVSTLEWTVNAYGLTYAAGIITAAGLGDHLGRRRVFAFGLALFTVASAACALAPTAALLLAARAVQGLGAAAVMPLSLTILTATFPPERRGAVVGMWGAIGGLAVASGPLIGGSLTEGLDWHWIFWVNVPIGLVVTALARVRLAESHGPAAPLDLPGMALVTAAAAALVWGIVSSAAAPLVAGGALLCGFVAWERRCAAPMIPLRLFASRTFAAANATAFLMIATIMAAAFLIAQYFQLVLADSPLEAGLRLLPWTATPMIVAPVAGALSDRIGPRPLMATGMLLQAGGLAWFVAEASTTTAYAALVVPLVVAGVGISMVMPTTPAAAIGAVAPAEIGKASGTNTTLQRFGGVFGVALVTAVFSAHGHLGDPAGFVAGLRPALAVAAGLSLLGALTAAAVAGRRRAVAVAAPVQQAASASA